MKTQIKIPNLDIPIIIQSYTKSKSVKIFYKKDSIKVTKPNWYSNRNIEKYIKDNIEKIKEEYINAQEKYDKQNKASNEFNEILFLGEKYKICKVYNKNKNSICLKDNYIYIELIYDNISNDELKNILKIYLKEKSKDIIEDRLIYLSNVTNIKYNKYRIKDCKSIWGSCSSKQNLNFNYKIIMFPIEVLDQIIIHELCHIKYLNHSEKFWNLVYTYCSKEKYYEGEKWIKQNINLINII